MPPKPKLTPEEKKALRAEKKEQKKLAKIEKKKQLKRDRLLREIKYGEHTKKHHEKDWEKMLIKIALPNIRDDLEFAWHNFERVIDCKDFTISLLMDELKEAEDQYVLNAKNHIENIDKLIDMFRESLEEFNLTYEQKVEKIQDFFKRESELKEAEATEGENDIKTMIYMLEQARKEQKRIMRAEYFTKLDEEETKITQTVQDLRATLLYKVAQLQRSMMDFVKNFQKTVKERKKDHNDLVTRDEAARELLAMQTKKLHENYETIKVLKHKLAQKQAVLGRRIKDYESEFNFFFLVYKKLREQLDADRSEDFDKLTILTQSFNITFEKLTKLKGKAEQILTLAAICRRLETVKEKIMPFPVTTDQHIPSQSPECIEELYLFYQRFAQAEASRYAINEERQFLKNENTILKTYLHKYCQCLTCPSVAKRTAVTVKHVTEGVEEYNKYVKHGIEDQFIGDEKIKSLKSPTQTFETED